MLLAGRGRSLNASAHVDYGSLLDDEFLARLRGLVRRTTRNDADADDVVQDSLVKLLRKGGAVPPSSVRAWLITVARREVIDRSRRRRLSPLDADVGDPREDGDDAAAYVASCLAPMLEGLSPSDRDLLRRVDVDEESQTDVARSSGVSASTVRSRVQRARGRLLARLEDCCSVERDRRGAPVDCRLRPGKSCAGASAPVSAEACRPRT